MIPEMKLALRIIFVLFLTLLLSACFSMAEKKQKNALDNAMNQYRIAMRWGRWDTLMGFRAVKAPEVPQQDLDNIRVTSYEIRQPPVAVSDGVVAQVVEIEYVLNDLQRLRKVYDRQEWRLDKENKVWELFSPFPEFK